MSNSGVTRSEKLTGWLDGGSQRTQQLPPSTGEMVGMGMAREVGRVTNEDLAGLEECFRKVCKVSQSMQSLVSAIFFCLVCLFVCFLCLVSWSLKHTY